MSKQCGMPGAFRQQLASETHHLRNSERAGRKCLGDVKLTEFPGAIGFSQARDRQMGMKSPRFARESNIGAVVFQIVMQLRQSPTWIVKTNPQNIGLPARRKFSAAGDRERKRLKAGRGRGNCML